MGSDERQIVRKCNIQKAALGIVVSENAAPVITLKKFRDN
jgi:hypothetical protein